jgi:DNA-binding transcriptional regulator YhcF (GntR family)
MNMQTVRFDHGTPLPNARAILRADDQAMLGRIAIASAPLDNAFTPTIIWYTIFAQNVHKLTRSAANLEYGAADSAPPDALREPVSVHALAKILRMPYETVRRQVVGLEAQGLCTRIPDKGLIVSNTTFARPELLQQVALGSDLLRTLLVALDRAGFDFAELQRACATPAAAAVAHPARMRAVMRLGLEYTLELFEVLRRAMEDDLMKAVFYLAVVSANTRDAAANVEKEKGAAPDFGRADALVPDELRRPVSVLALSGALKVPYETLRRALGMLEDDGVLKRIKRLGLIVPAEVQARIENEGLVRKRLSLLRRYMADLQQAGVALPG